VYRWSQDGLARLCDREQRLCFAVSFWNGRDPILKERIFGASWLRWRYHYPQPEFPYGGVRIDGAAGFAPLL
jgi:hypothetical protein